MIERVIAVLLAVLASLGLVQPAEAVPGTSAPVAGHAYDDAEQSSAVIYTATERGPPGAADATYDAVVLGSHGASPRAASPSTADAYPGTPLQVALPTTTTDAHAGATDREFLLARRAGVAANTAEATADAALASGRTTGAAAELRAGGVESPIVV
jgi:hypothetical protein